MSKAWARGSTPQWRKTRARVLRDNTLTNQGLCCLQLPGCTGTTPHHPTVNHVHHVVGKAVSGDDPAYLVASCEACNLKAGQPERNSPPHRKVSRW